MFKVRFGEVFRYARSNPKQGILLLIIAVCGVLVLTVCERWVGAWADDVLMHHTSVLSVALIGSVEFMAQHPFWSMLIFSGAVVGGHLIHAYWITHPFHSWSKDNKDNEIKDISSSASTESPLSLPQLRPNVYATRYDGTPDRRYGLFIRNDGDVAFEINIEPIQIGTSRLEFWSGIAVLPKDKGEALIESHIQTGSHSGTFGNALMGEMTKFGLPDIALNITYKDAQNIWYVTEQQLERDVLARGSGIAVKFITQKKTTEPKKDNDIPNVNTGSVPDIALTWDLPEERKNARLVDSELEKDIMVHNRSDKYLYNVQIQPVPLYQELTFDLINEIAPGRQHLTLGRWDGKSSLTTKWAYYFCNQHNAEAAFEKGWIFDKLHQRGLSKQFYKVPMAVKYECGGIPYCAEFEFIYDIGDESSFLKKAAYRI